MYSWEINRDWAVTGRSGIALFDVRGDHFTQYQQTVSLDTILNERLGAVASWEMLIDHGHRSGSSQHVANVGASFFVKKNLAINCRVGAGISAAAPDFIYDIGFAYSF